MSTVAGANTPPPPPRPSPTRSARPSASAGRCCGSSKTFIAGVVIVGFFVILAIFGETLAPDDPFATNPLNDLAAPSWDHLFGTDRVGRDILSRVMVGRPQHHDRGAGGDAARHGPGHDPRPRHRLLPRAPSTTS